MRLSPSPDAVERRLLLLAGGFVLAYALALTFSPAARLRSWRVDYRWGHWLGVGVWGLAFSLAHLRAVRRLPGRDPLLLPIVALLSGWGLMTIWRLLPGFGLRQTAWLGLSGMVLAAGFDLAPDLAFLRRYKYVWLSGALLLTAATLVFGSNPLGYGPPMWLGCCGIYLQPSEPLKLLLAVYLAAFLAGQQPYLILAASNRTPLSRWMKAMIPLLAPAGIMIGLTLAILVIQRDLGSAAVFSLIFAAGVYVAIGQRRWLVIAGLALGGAGLTGYLLYDVVRVRVEAWLNPWADPAGRSYQIIQSLIAIANGGIAGRGPGLGSPSLAPLAHSDLIFSAVAEELGLAGVLALLALLALLATRGMWIALQAGDHFRRYLAVGLTTLLVGQALLIIAGSMRLLPLTGVTLPFMSYGGSSLLTSFLAALLLLRISSRPEPLPARLYSARPYQQLGAALLAAAGLCALTTGWWILYRGSALLGRTDNQRRAIADRYVRRGALLDRNDLPLAASSGQPGEYTRRITDPDLSSVVGYTDPTYGQAGLEAGLDDLLRGLRGQPSWRVLTDRLLYGQPPPGLDVRLSLDLALQRKAEALFHGQPGALVLLNARTGQILAMVSAPTFNANRLAEQWDQLVNDPSAPLLNRAALGRYPLGDLEQQLFSQGLAPLETDLRSLQSLPIQPAIPALGAPAAGLRPEGYSPLELALAAAAISLGGERPIPRIALAAQLPPAAGGSPGLWQDLSPAGDLSPQSSAASTLAPAMSPALQRVYSGSTAATLAERYAVAPDLWQTTVTIAPATQDAAVWSVAGTPPHRSGVPYALALILEQDDPALAARIARAVLGFVEVGQP